MRIHQVIEEHVLVHEIDPIRGHVHHRRPVMKPGSTISVKHQGVVYECEPDGSFELPPEVAQFFLRQPTWYEGANPFGPEPDAEPVKPAAKRAQTVKA